MVPVRYAVTVPDTPPAGADRVLRAAFAAPPYEYTPAKIRDRMDSWGRFVAEPGFRCVEAHAGGELVGIAWGWPTAPGLGGQLFAGLYRHLRDELGGAADLLTGWEVVEVAVDPAAQGQGVGSGLLAALTDDGPGWLLTRTTAPASGWYARHGWTLLATLPGEPGLDVFTRHTGA